MRSGGRRRKSSQQHTVCDCDMTMSLWARSNGSPTVWEPFCAALYNIIMNLIVTVLPKRREARDTDILQERTCTKEPPYCKGGWCGGRRVTITNHQLNPGWIHSRRWVHLIRCRSIGVDIANIWTMSMGWVSEMMLFQEGIIKSVPSESQSAIILMNASIVRQAVGDRGVEIK